VAEEVKEKSNNSSAASNNNKNNKRVTIIINLVITIKVYDLLNNVSFPLLIIVPS
jgi:hypothetical protein